MRDLRTAGERLRLMLRRGDTFLPKSPYEGPRLRFPDSIDSKRLGDKLSRDGERRLRTGGDRLRLMLRRGETSL